MIVSAYVKERGSTGKDTKGGGGEDNIFAPSAHGSLQRIKKGGKNWRHLGERKRGTDGQ